MILSRPPHMVHFVHSVHPVHSARRGTALVIVLWISFGLAAMALYFGHAMMLQYRAGANTVAALQAEQAVEGAARYIQYVLTNSAEAGAALDQTLFQSEAIAVDEAQFWLVGRDPQDSTGKTISYGLVDEAGKLNLNTATVDMLEGLPGMTPELAGAIVDWRDSDSDVSTDGAESDSYALRQPASQCKNGPFETVDELRLVLGADWNILFGEDANLNGALDPNEDDEAVSEPPDNHNGVLDPGVLEYVTVFSREPNKAADGSARLNIANASSQEIGRRLADTLGEDRAREIERALGPRPPRFSSTLDFYVQAQLTKDEFDQVEDLLTVTDGDTIPGRVNINAAPEAVLACLPGIGTDNAQTAMAYRQGKTSEDLVSSAWLVEAIGAEAAVQAGPFVTTHSYQFSADVAAVGAGGRGFRRVFFVFDTSQGAPTVIYRRERSPLGWPLGESARTQPTSPSTTGGTR
ncbi:MAG: type II secretion system protein GspK [Candidatus Sumerlaeota bacterium]|nr:type II secretion system protein GspK [Candidatus Sumerlaeota bacterium]